MQDRLRNPVEMCQSNADANKKTAARGRRKEMKRNTFSVCERERERSRGPVMQAAFYKNR